MTQLHQPLFLADPHQVSVKGPNKMYSCFTVTARQQSLLLADPHQVSVNGSSITLFCLEVAAVQQPLSLAETMRGDTPTYSLTHLVVAAVQQPLQLTDPLLVTSSSSSTWFSMTAMQQSLSLADFHQVSVEGPSRMYFCFVMAAGQQPHPLTEIMIGDSPACSPTLFPMAAVQQPFSLVDTNLGCTLGYIPQLCSVAVSQSHNQLHHQQVIIPVRSQKPVLILCGKRLYDPPTTNTSSPPYSRKLKFLGRHLCVSYLVICFSIFCSSTHSMAGWQLQEQEKKLSLCALCSHPGDNLSGCGSDSKHKLDKGNYNLFSLVDGSSSVVGVTTGLHAQTPPTTAESLRRSISFVALAQPPEMDESGKLASTSLCNHLNVVTYCDICSSISSAGRCLAAQPRKVGDLALGGCMKWAGNRSHLQGRHPLVQNFVQEHLDIPQAQLVTADGLQTPPGDCHLWLMEDVSKGTSYNPGFQFTLDNSALKLDQIFIRFIPSASLSTTATTASCPSYLFYLCELMGGAEIGVETINSVSTLARLTL